MTKTYKARLVKNLGEVTSADKGETIVFELVLGEQESDLTEDVCFAVNHAGLSLLLAGLMGAGTEAEKIREQNPIHADGTGGGYAFKLNTGSIGPTSKGDHILELEVSGSAGAKLKYRLRLDRLGIENLCGLLDWYLGELDSGNPQPQKPN